MNIIACRLTIVTVMLTIVNFYNNFAIADTKYRSIQSLQSSIDTAAFDKYINSVPYAQLIPLYTKLVKIPFETKEVKPINLYFYASRIVNRLESFRDHKPAEYITLSTPDWVEAFNLKLSKEVLITHVQLLALLYKNEETFRYAALTEQYIHYQSAPVNSVYALLLDQYGDKDRLKEVLLKSMYQNQGTPEMVGLLAKLYLAEHRPENEFSNYLQSLKNRSGRNELKADILKEMINKPMPKWKLYDTNGTLINSAALIGKTVVLDFWATWCTAAKTSFPAMKLVVDKYKNDPDVVFYFVDTEESTTNYKTEVKNFMKQIDYHFQVLFDTKLKHSHATGEVFESVRKSFQISEIPRKLIIDPKGNLRFITTGQVGSTAEISDDISAMINYAKSGK